MSDSESTELRTPGGVDVAIEAGVACMACGHPVKDHDRISSRYCDATIAHATTRRCICAGQAPERP